MIDEVATIGNLLTIRGYGLKVESDDDHCDEVGLFFDPEDNGRMIKTEIIAVNEPRTLKVIVPAGLEADKDYTLVIITQSSARNGTTILKNTRELRSDFTLSRQTPTG